MWTYSGHHLKGIVKNYRGIMNRKRRPCQEQTMMEPVENYCVNCSEPFGRGDCVIREIKMNVFLISEEETPWSLEKLKKRSRKSPPKLTEEAVSVQIILSNVYKLDYLLNTKLEDRNKIGVCTKCANILRNLYMNHMEFNKIRSATSYLANKIQQLDWTLQQMQNTLKERENNKSCDDSLVTGDNSGDDDSEILVTHAESLETSKFQNHLNDSSTTRLKSDPDEASMRQEQFFTTSRKMKLDDTSENSTTTTKIKNQKGPWVRLTRLRPEEIPVPNIVDLDPDNDDTMEDYEQSHFDDVNGSEGTSINEYCDQSTENIPCLTSDDNHQDDRHQNQSEKSSNFEVKYHNCTFCHMTFLSHNGLKSHIFNVHEEVKNRVKTVQTTTSTTKDDEESCDGTPDDVVPDAVCNKDTLMTETSTVEIQEVITQSGNVVNEEKNMPQSPPAKPPPPHLVCKICNMSMLPQELQSHMFNLHTKRSSAKQDSIPTQKPVSILREPIASIPPTGIQYLGELYDILKIPLRSNERTIHPPPAADKCVPSSTSSSKNEDNVNVQLDEGQKEVNGLFLKNLIVFRGGGQQQKTSRSTTTTTNEVVSDVDKRARKQLHEPQGVPTMVDGPLNVDSLCENACRFYCRLCKKSWEDGKKFFAHLELHGCHSCFLCPNLFFLNSIHLRGHVSTAHTEMNPLECPRCNKVCMGQDNLEAHVQTCDSRGESRRLKCPQLFCDKYFFKSVNLECHIRTVHGQTFVVENDREFKCSECPKSFPNNYDLNCHFGREHPEKKFSCSDCQKSYGLEQDLRQHARTHLPPQNNDDETRQTLKCKFCTKAYQHRTPFAIHERVHTGELPYVCSVEGCSEAFRSQGELKIHHTIHDPTRRVSSKKFVCEWCRKEFLKPSRLRRHQEVHIRNTKSAHPCTSSFCPRVFTTQKELEVHLGKCKGGELSFMCEICSKTFTHQHLLTKHMKCHSVSEKSFQCTQCPKKFGTMNSLLNHERLHSGEATLTCTVEGCQETFVTTWSLHRHLLAHRGKTILCTVCGYACQTMYMLKVHMRRHTMEKPYNCPFCDKTFRRSQSRKDHLRSHSNEKPYLCSTCGQGFKQSRTLKRHILTHTGEKQYTCHVCGMGFPDNRSLKIHLLKHEQTKDEEFSEQHMDDGEEVEEEIDDDDCDDQEMDYEYSASDQGEDDDDDEESSHDD